nr:DUF3231 family protein [Caldalkalibacillus salinus]
MTAIEISHITFNMNKMYLHIALKTGFAQVSQIKNVRDMILRGVDITLKQTEVFESMFREEQLNFPTSWESTVTNSTVPPFSEKLMMYMVQLSTQAAIAFYGASVSTTNRRDLGTHYLRLIPELIKYGEDCMNIMIDHGWMEKPPSATDRKALAKEKKQNSD